MQVLQWIEDFENRYSIYIPGNWISEVNEHAGEKEVELKSGDIEILNAAQLTFYLSESHLDPSFFPLSKLWRLAISKGEVPSDKQVEEMRALVNWNKVEITNDSIFLPTKGMGLDFGGFGKEYAIDQTGKILMEANITHFLIDYGGDILAHGFTENETPWTIGIEKWDGSEEKASVVYLNNRAIASSGSYRRFFELGGKRFSHIIDGQTGFPTLNDNLSASVLNSSCLKAGILATCVVLEGSKNGLRRIDRTWDTDCLIQGLDLHLQTDNFNHIPFNEN